MGAYQRRPFRAQRGPMFHVKRVAAKSQVLRQAGYRVPGVSRETSARIQPAREGKRPDLTITMRTETSDGETPEMRDACPRF